FSVVSGIFGGIFTFLLVVVISFYLAIQQRGIENFLRLIAPVKYEAYLIDLWERSQKQLGRWLRAQILLGAIVGLAIFIGLTILGMEHALLFAIMAAVFEIIPVAGPLLASIPPLIAAFLSDYTLGLMILALYVGVQQLESHVIVPLIIRRSVGLNPLVVVLALLIGGKLGGIFGILLSVPIAAVAVELIKDWDKKKRNS
ncbi:MAG: AI-2E family transporter, partial [Patescibacteria group bacterium]